MFRSKRLLSVLLGSLLVAGLAVGVASGGLDGKFKVTGGHRLHLVCVGKGSPVVVLETGLGDEYLGWDPAIRQATPLHTTVCGYDRYGLGSSDGSRTFRPFRTVAQDVTDLHALLRSAKLKGPYVFVDHSMGGLIDRAYAKRYPKDVAGMVLLDTAPDDWDIYTGIETFVGGNENIDVRAASASLRASDSLGAKPSSSSRQTTTPKYRAATPATRPISRPTGTLASARWQRFRAIRLSSLPLGALTVFRTTSRAWSFR